MEYLQKLILDCVMRQDLVSEFTGFICLPAIADCGIDVKMMSNYIDRFSFFLTVSHLSLTEWESYVAT